MFFENKFYHIYIFFNIYFIFYYNNLNIYLFYKKFLLKNIKLEMI